MIMSRLTVNPRYEHLRAFIEQIPATMESEGRYIYGGRRNLIVSMEAPDGTQLNVKRFCQPRLPNRLIYSTGIRQPKGQRAFTYPAQLLAKGIETPEAVAYIEERNALHLLRQCYFVSIQCPYSHLLYEMGDAQPRVYEPMAQALARFAAHMHEQEVLHRDFSPGNILWEYGQQDDKTSFRFSIVDINRMEFGLVDIVKGCANFARLWGQPEWFVQLASDYAAARGADPQECIRLVLEARAKFWKPRARHFNLPYTLRF